MMNPSDIAHKQFERIRGKGYRPEEVDLFLSQVAGSWKAWPPKNGTWSRS